MSVIATDVMPDVFPREWLEEYEGFVTVYVFGVDGEVLVQSLPFAGWNVDHCFAWEDVSIVIQEMTWQLEVDGWGTDSRSYGEKGRGVRVDRAKLTVVASWANGDAS